MVNGIRTLHHCRLDKGFDSKFYRGLWVWLETPEEGWRTHLPKFSEYNKDEDKSLNTLDDENYQTLISEI